MVRILLHQTLVCSLHCFSISVVCRLVLFHFCVFPWCLRFLVHSVVAKLVVSKNCPKLVHKYLQNYSKTQYHKKLKLCQKVAWNLCWDKITINLKLKTPVGRKVRQKCEERSVFTLIQASLGFSCFYSIIQDDPNAAKCQYKKANKNH